MLKFFRKRGIQPRKPFDGERLRLAEIPQAIKIIDDFPRADWQEIKKAMVAHAAHPMIDEMWTEIAAQWIETVGRHLGGEYEVYESKRLLLLSSQSMEAVRCQLETGDAAYEMLEKVVGRTAKARGLGKHAVLIFGTRDAGCLL